MAMTDDAGAVSWPDPINNGWAVAWKQMADQLAEVVEALLVHFGNEDQTRTAQATLAAYEDFTSYDDCHGTGAHKVCAGCGTPIHFEDGWVADDGSDCVGSHHEPERTNASPSGATS